MSEDTTASTEEQKEDSKPDKDEEASATESEKGTEQETAEKSTDESKPAEAEEKATEEKEESKADTPKEVSLDEILAREDVQRAIQSVSDKAVDKADKRAKDAVRQKRREEEERQRQQDEDDLLDEARSSGDFGAYGEKQATLRAKEKQTDEHFADFNEAYVGELLNEYEDLGNDAINSALAKGRESGRGVAGFQSALAEERTRRAVDSTKSEALKDRNQLIADEVAAQLAAAGVEKRSQKAEEGETASEKVSGKAKGKAARSEMTDTDWENQWNEGEITFGELPEHLQKKYGG
ncbi:hypothetical protein LCGC14_1654380 [marine sediment metagenome]|uniref:Uncharacterized protein n=1 Tax=marine sediment metagenome TaxID=412755 RepID=A0A0F9KW82_9ZZZZ